MENLVITQNFLNALNHSNSSKLYTEPDPPTQFSNGANVDGGRSLIYIDPDAMRSHSDYVITREASQSTQKLLRIADKGIINRQGSSNNYPVVYDKNLNPTTITWDRLRNVRFEASRLLSSGRVLTSNSVTTQSPTIALPWYGTFNSQDAYDCVYCGLIEGTGNVWKKESVDFTGKLLKADQSYSALSSIPHDGGVLMKMTFRNESSSSFSQVDALVISYTLNHLYSDYMPLPIMAALNLGTAVSTSQYDTIQVTLEIDTSYTA